MPKKYPWQRWPDKKKRNPHSDYHGQNKEPSWKDSSMNTIKAKALRDQSVYDEKPADNGKIWIHEGYYIDEETAIDVAEKHNGVYKRVDAGIYEGSYEVFAKIGRSKQLLVRAKKGV